MILLAILFPGISFLLRGKIFSAIIALILQVVAFLTFLLFGVGFFIWLILAILAVVSYNNGKAERRNEKIMSAMRQRQ